MAPDSHHSFDWSLLYTRSQDGMVLMSADGRILDANPKACELLGYTREEMTGLTSEGLVAPQDLGSHRQRLAGVAHRPIAFLERHLRRKDGSILVIEGGAIAADDGRVIGLMRDISERKRFENEARTSQALKSAMLDAALDAVVSIDHEGMVIEFNAAAERMFGYSREQAMGREMASLIVPERLRAAHRSGMARFLATGQATVLGRRLELPAVRADGSEFEIEISICRLAIPGPPRFTAFLRDLSNQKAAEAAAERQERMFRALIEKASDVVSIIARDGTIRYVSPAIRQVLGRSPESLVGRNVVRFVHPEDIPTIQAAFAEIVARGSIHPLELRFRARGGQWRLLQGTGTNRFDDPSIQGLVVNARDVTERRIAEDALRHSEEKLRHAQRLESIGRLAGGVAHDFNNLLTVIMAYSEHQLERLGPAHELFRSASEIRKAADRAAALTRQLLAFSRRQVLEPRVLDLNSVLADLGPMLERLIGEDIDLHLHPGADVAAVRVDRGQIEQVVMNLVVNARDAMPNGGRLTLATGRAELDPTAASRHDAPNTGTYVTLVVSDSGSGMDPETRAKLFEPFFTTKPRGEGTGLGLSTVYGIVQQSGGAVAVESEPGEGSTFTVYLPVAPQTTVSVEPHPERASPGGGTETVLLVEDEEVVRELMSELLAEAGYMVLEAPGGRRALEMAAAFDGRIHLLLTDVVMPGMSGRELAQRLVVERAGIRVLYVSGYTQDLIAQQGILDPGVHLLPKPFEPDAFTRKVREVLDTPDRRAA